MRWTPSWVPGIGQPTGAIVRTRLDAFKQYYAAVGRRDMRRLAQLLSPDLLEQTSAATGIGGLWFRYLRGDRGSGLEVERLTALYFELNSDRPLVHGHVDLKYRRECWSIVWIHRLHFEGTVISGLDDLYYEAFPTPAWWDGTMS